jgi:hypothetical protein
MEQWQKDARDRLDALDPCSDSEEAAQMGWVLECKGDVFLTVQEAEWLARRRHYCDARVKEVAPPRFLRASEILQLALQGERQ